MTEPVNLAPAPPPDLADDPHQATACCVRHRRIVRWIPAPGWWIHTDHRSCGGCWGAPDPLGYDWMPNLPGYAGYSPGRYLR